jgi:benzoyl-CoA reductase/2-hydroxyglutaryl-CoA dehydratase subunit BcrC/BadD/HgdB
MTQNWTEMWTNLGLDLEAHDALLGVLGQAYQDIFLAQPNRPKGMEYFDFVMSEVHGLRVKELLDAKAAGRNVIGSFCVFVPEELVLAIDGVFVGLCAGAEFGYEKAEAVLPRNTCALIKSFFGFAMSKVCPYLEAADLIVGESTCDGKKKSYEIFADYVKELYVMDLPQKKTAAGRALLKAEFEAFGKKLEALSGRTITVDALKRGIATANAKRAALHRLAKLRAANPAPISGLDALLANQIFFYDDPGRFTSSVHAVCDELEQRITAGVGVAEKNAPRILMAGCPMAVPNWKVPAVVENTGAVIVGEESCVGERGTQYLVDDSADTVDGLMEAIIDRYFKIDCAIFTPNPTRLEHIRRMVEDYQADGVIHYNLQFCGPYQVESGPVESELRAAGVPVLRIDTDYSTEDTEQIRTRVEAFIEQLRQ